MPVLAKVYWRFITWLRPTGLSIRSPESGYNLKEKRTAWTCGVEPWRRKEARASCVGDKHLALSHTPTPRERTFYMAKNKKNSMNVCSNRVLPGKMPHLCVKLTAICGIQTRRHGWFMPMHLELSHSGSPQTAKSVLEHMHLATWEKQVFN